MATPGSGMFLPTIPLAWALRTAGHEVLLANNGAAAAAVTRAGLNVVDPCPDRDVWAEFMAASHAINTTPPGEPRPARGGLGLFGEEMAEGLLAVAEEFRPDLVLSTLEQGAGPLVAALLGVPHVEQSVRLAWAAGDDQARGHRDRIAAYLEPTRARLGLPRPAPSAAVIDLRPPSLGGVAGADVWLMRYVPYNEAKVLPRWAIGVPDRPRVCVTFGSALPVSAAADALRELVTVLAGKGFEVVLAVPDEDSAALAPLPDHVRVVGWLPLNALLPTCEAIVHHGGAGTTFTAMTCGLPQVVIPFNADQPANADVVAARGTGIRVPPTAMGPADVAAALAEVLDDPAFRTAATELREEIAAQPDPHAVVARLMSVHTGH
ncbi:MAG: nucleotide disphospho-sugar-binding domain-containing protein [Actinophytocola sp.]|uniref:nucleotide disphospho-sugar-binding domain-containing protein n=1 Tax=Actinophytocola sp. TaxID=1872138 RepID=UPI003C7402F6